MYPMREYLKAWNHVWTHQALGNACWINDSIYRFHLMWRQRSKKSETTPGMQQRTWSTAGTPNKSENWVKCKQNDKLCQRSPCMFLFERWSIFYYFSNLVLEFWKQFKNRHSWDVTVISSDTSHTLKLFFFLRCQFLRWIYSPFSKAERRPLSTCQFP